MKKIFIITLILVIAASLLASSCGEDADKTTRCNPTTTCEPTLDKTETVKTTTCGSTTTCETTIGENATDKSASGETAEDASEVNEEKTSVPKITFLELGSTTCIPCKKMKPVLKSISEKYGEQIEVEFIDLKEDRAAAKKYKIRMMPTQVFLNEKGEEIHRHVGYYPEEQIEEFLQIQGLIPASKK